MFPDANGPQAVYISRHPINFLETHLSNIKKIEGLPVEEYIRKQKNFEEEFAPKPGETENE